MSARYERLSDMSSHGSVRAGSERTPVAVVLLATHGIWSKVDMGDELAVLDATAQAELVRRREVTPVELVDAAIERLPRGHPPVTARGPPAPPPADAGRARRCGHRTARARQSADQCRRPAGARAGPDACRPARSAARALSRRALSDERPRRSRSRAALLRRHEG